MGDNLVAVDLGAGRTALELAAGNVHSCARLDNGQVKCWGGNASGQLGLGDINHRGDGAGELGDNLPAVDLGSGRKAVQLIAGSLHNCALLDDGQVKCWGRNASGELGLGDTDTRGDGAGEMGDNLPAVAFGTAGQFRPFAAVQLAAGGNHTCARLIDAVLVGAPPVVKCWGGGGAGQLGLGNQNARGDGPGEMGNNLPAVDLGSGRHALDLAANGGATCARLDNGALKCWGHNGVGQLGLGDSSNRGDDPGEMGDNLPALVLGTGRTAVGVGVGEVHTCALLDNGQVKCWGDNDHGKLGLGDVSDRGDDAGEMGDNLPAVDVGS